MYQVSQLERGLHVATVSMPHMKSVSVGVWVATGSRYEPPALNGVCHFIEHLLFKGTRRRSARQISQAVEGIGGYLNAYTSEEVTCFHARACHSRLQELVDVLMDMLLNSRFDPGDIVKEREVIKEEISMYLDEPQHQVQELLNATLWPDQPLGRPITGTSETLDAMGRSELVGFLERYYVARSAIVVASGNVRHGQLLRAVTPFAKRFHNGLRPSFTAAQDGQTAPVVNLATKKTEQTQIALGIRGCSRHDSCRFAMRLLNTILGENMSSRLFQVIREDRGLAYSIYSSPSFFADTGDLVISAGLDTENLEKVIRLIIAELRRIKEKGPTRSELRRARDYVIGQIELGEENSESQMNWVGEQLAGYGRIIRPAELKRRIRAVTGGEIRAVACEFFRPNRLNLAVVSPLRHVNGVRRALERL